MVLSIAVALVIGIAQLLGISSDEPGADVSATTVGSGTDPGPPVATADADVRFPSSQIVNCVAGEKLGLNTRPAGPKFPKDGD